MTDDGEDDAEYGLHQTADLHAAAANTGRVLVQPEPNELFIDCDSMDALKRTVELLGIFKQSRDCGWTTKPSRTLGHYHVTVTLHDCDVVGAWERIFFQALLGSDPKRELLAAVQAWNDDKDPVSVFYEEP